MTMSYLSSRFTDQIDKLEIHLAMLKSRPSAPAEYVTTSSGKRWWIDPRHPGEWFDMRIKLWLREDAR